MSNQKVKKLTDAIMTGGLYGTNEKVKKLTDAIMTGGLYGTTLDEGKRSRLCKTRIVRFMKNPAPSRRPKRPKSCRATSSKRERGPAAMRQASESSRSTGT